MSSTLMWAPAKRDATSLPDELKFILRDKRGIDGRKVVFDNSQIEYLSALDDAGIKGASELMDAIRKHEEVEIWLEF